MSFPRLYFDLIIFWHSLEHIEEIDRNMAQIHDLLHPEGVLLLAVPNFASLESCTFKTNWFHLDLPWHKYHFNMQSLTCLLGKNNLQIVKWNTLCFEQGPYGLVQSVLNALGWPKNELYEALKRNRAKNRSLPIVIQLFLFLILITPAFLLTFITALGGKGSILKLIVQRRD